MRDAKHIAQLEHMGWSTLVVWECELRDADQVAERIRAFLEGEQ